MVVEEVAVADRLIWKRLAQIGTLGYFHLYLVSTGSVGNDVVIERFPHS